MENECVQIIRDNGVGWMLDGSLSLDSTVLYDKLGRRTGGLTDSVAWVKQPGVYINIPNTSYFNGIGAGSFSVGCNVMIPTGAGGSGRHVLFAKEGEWELFHEGGYIGFRVIGSTDAEVFSSSNGYADGKFHHVVAFRDSRYSQHVIGVWVYGGGSQTLNISPSLELGTSGDVKVAETAYNGTILSGVFFARGNVVNQDAFDRYRLDGFVPFNKVIFYKLNEAAGEIVYDASGLQNHGVTVNYAEGTYVASNFVYDWSNLKGYSTGTHVVDHGVATVVVGEDVYPVDVDSHIPAHVTFGTQDVLGGLLEYYGRCSLKVEVKDILTFKGNGSTYGVMDNPDIVGWIPGTDSFTVMGLFRHVAGEEQGIFLIGDSGQPRYYARTVSDRLEVGVGGSYSSAPISEGWVYFAVVVDATDVRVYVDGTLLLSFVAGSSFSPIDDSFVMTTNGSNVMTQELVCLLFLQGAQSESVVDAFAEGVIPIVGVRSAYFPMSRWSTVFDVSGYGNHVQLTSYNQNVWQGRQSEIPYFIRGFSKVYLNINDVPVYIPNTLAGEPQGYSVYGVGQIMTSIKYSEGMPVFDFTLDMNPDGLSLGFWTWFFDKSNSDVWNISAGGVSYDGVNRWHWKPSELKQAVIDDSLYANYRYFLFVGAVVNKYLQHDRLFDLVLLNLGSNSDPVPVPLKR